TSRHVSPSLKMPPALSHPASVIASAHVPSTMQQAPVGTIATTEVTRVIAHPLAPTDESVPSTKRTCTISPVEAQPERSNVEVTKKPAPALLGPENALRPASGFWQQAETGPR